MTRTEYQKEAFAPTTRGAGDRHGVVLYATHSPTLTSQPTTAYPYSPAPRTAGPSHRTAIIGLTGLALLLATMGGIAYLRFQETTAPATVAVQAAQPVAQSVYESQVPYLARMTVPASVVAQQVPHAAAAVLVADSVYAEQVPAAARITVPASVVAQQVPTAPLAVTVPHGALAAQAAEAAGASVMVPQSVYDSQVPTAPLTVTVPHGALAAQAAEAAGASVMVPQSVYESQVPEEAR